MANEQEPTIIHFSHCNLQEGMASTVHVCEIVENLKQMGFTLKVLAAGATKDLRNRLEPLITSSIPIKGLHLLSSVLMSNISLFLITCRLKPAVIYYRRMLLDPLPALVCLLCRTPLIIELNETVEPHIRELAPVWLWRGILNAFEKVLFHCSTAIICPSETMQRYYVSTYPMIKNKLTIIPHGVNLDLFQPILKAEARRQLGLSDGIYLLWAGTGFWWSGMNFLLDIGRALNRRQSQLRLLIIGEGDEIHDLKKVVHEENIENFVFLPRLPYRAMPTAYSAATILLAPYNYEYLTARGFPFKIIEALACATPVMTIKAPVSQEIDNLVDGIIMIEDYDIETWVKKIEQLIDQEDNMQSLGEKGRCGIISHDLTWLSATKKIADLIYRVK